MSDRDAATAKRFAEIRTIVNGLGLVRYGRFERPQAQDVLDFLRDVEAERDALLADTLVLMDQTASPEVQMEARRRIIERHGAFPK